MIYLSKVPIFMKKQQASLSPCFEAEVRDSSVQREPYPGNRKAFNASEIWGTLVQTIFSHAILRWVPFISFVSGACVNLLFVFSCHVFIRYQIIIKLMTIAEKTVTLLFSAYCFAAFSSSFLLPSRQRYTPPRMAIAKIPYDT